MAKVLTKTKRQCLINAKEERVIDAFEYVHKLHTLVT